MKSHQVGMLFILIFLIVVLPWQMIVALPIITIGVYWAAMKGWL